jgi:hypothetical protein
MSHPFLQSTCVALREPVSAPPLSGWCLSGRFVLLGPRKAHDPRRNDQPLAPNWRHRAYLGNLAMALGAMRRAVCAKLLFLSCLLAGCAEHAATTGSIKARTVPAVDALPINTSMPPPPEPIRSLPAETKRARCDLRQRDLRAGVAAVKLESKHRRSHQSHKARQACLARLKRSTRASQPEKQFRQVTYLGDNMGAMFFLNRQPLEIMGRSEGIRTPDSLLPKQTLVPSFRDYDL